MTARLNRVSIRRKDDFGKDFPHPQEHRSVERYSHRSPDHPLYSALLTPRKPLSTIRAPLTSRITPSRSANAVPKHSLSSMHALKSDANPRDQPYPMIRPSTYPEYVNADPFENDIDNAEGDVSPSPAFLLDMSFSQAVHDFGKSRTPHTFTQASQLRNQTVKKPSFLFPFAGCNPFQFQDNAHQTNAGQNDGQKRSHFYAEMDQDEPGDPGEAFPRRRIFIDSDQPLNPSSFANVAVDPKICRGRSCCCSRG